MTTIEAELLARLAQEFAAFRKKTLAMLEAQTLLIQEQGECLIILEAQVASLQMAAPRGIPT